LVTTSRTYRKITSRTYRKITSRTYRKITCRVRLSGSLQPNQLQIFCINVLCPSRHVTSPGES